MISARLYLRLKIKRLRLQPADISICMPYIMCLLNTSADMVVYSSSAMKTGYHPEHVKLGCALVGIRASCKGAVFPCSSHVSQTSSNTDWVLPKNRPIPSLLDETLRPRMGHHRLLHSICCGRDIARPVPVVPHPAPLDSGQEGDVLAAAAAKHLPCQLCAAPVWRTLHILPIFSHAHARQAEDRGQGRRIRDFCCRPGHHRLGITREVLILKSRGISGQDNARSLTQFSKNLCYFILHYLLARPRHCERRKTDSTLFMSSSALETRPSTYTWASP